MSIQAPPAPAPTAEGAVRRLRALAACSWTPRAIERAAGLPAGDVRRSLEGNPPAVDGFTAAVAGAYDQLWDRRPPRVTAAEKAAAEAIRAEADRRGWAPPAAWDDEIDLPAAAPAPGWKRSTSSKIRCGDLAEDAEFVRRHGGYAYATHTEVAMRLGVTTGQLEKALARARRPASSGREPVHPGAAPRASSTRPETP